jgi:serine/threonine protein kinase/Tfp pilus assembly protein PilF
VGASVDSAPPAIAGYLPAQLIAHSYLGSLWIALDQRQGMPGRPVLLRRLQLQEGIPSEALQRMACAARDAMALSHENVLHVLAVLQQADSLAVAYEYVEAEPLRSLQAWATQRSLRFPVAVSLRIVSDLARGIKALHGTLAGWPSAPPFGGISPDSVLVARDGRTRLCDALTASCATLLEGLSLNVAKLAYTAPEQAYATAPLAPVSDVFSCGVLLWELLAGTRLLNGSRPTVERKLLEHDWPRLAVQLAGQPLAPALLELVERCLSSDTSKRPPTPAALASELEQCGEPVAQLPEVARFIAELATSRFDERKLAVRASLQLPAQTAAVALLAPTVASAVSLPALAAPVVTTAATSSPATPSPAAAEPPSPPATSTAAERGSPAQPGAQRSPAAAAPRASAANLRIPLPAKLSSAALRPPVPAAPSAAPAAASASAAASATVTSGGSPSAAAPGRYSMSGSSDGVSLGRISLVRSNVPRPRNSQSSLRAVSLSAAEPPALTPAPAPPAPPIPEPTVAPQPPAAPAPRPSAEPVPVLAEGGSVSSGPSATPGVPTAAERASSAAPAAPAASSLTPTPAAASAAPPVPIFGVRRVRRTAAAGGAAAPAGSQPPPSEAPATERSPSLHAATSAPPVLGGSTPPESGWGSVPPGITAGAQAAPAVAADADAPLSQEAVVIPEARAVPTGMTTLMGIPVPPPVLLPNLPFASLPPPQPAPRAPVWTPGSSPAVVVIPPESSESARPPSVSSLPPLPLGSLVPTLAPPPFSEPPAAPASAPISAGLRREGGWSHPPEPYSTRNLRRRSWLARAGATVALGAALVTVLWVRDAGRGPVSSTASAPAQSAAALPAPASSAPPLAAPVLTSAEPSAAAQVLETPRELSDEQLRALFALEQRATFPDCSEPRGAARLPASRARQKSQTQFDTALRERARGNLPAAQALLCSATQLNPGNLAAWQLLAQLALQRGDAAQAERTLQRALKAKPGDPTLLSALGDAQALLGNLQQSRRLWARSAPASDNEAQPTQRLAAQFDASGERALRSKSFTTALAHYRRAVVLSAGASSPSAGMARALIGLDQPLAAEPWERRAKALRE